MKKSSERKDTNGVLIHEGDNVILQASPYHGEYTVCYGEYMLKTWNRNDKKHSHLGWYLSNGKYLIPLVYVLNQPLNNGATRHVIKVVDSTNAKQNTEYPVIVKRIAIGSLVVIGLIVLNYLMS